MSTNHTTNYDLNQWEGTDKVLRTEFNADNAKIDAALKANADAIAAEAAAREAAETALENKLGLHTLAVNTLSGSGVERFYTQFPADMDWSQWKTIHIVIDPVQQAGHAYRVTIHYAQGTEYLIDITYNPAHIVLFPLYGQVTWFHGFYMIDQEGETMNIPSFGLTCSQIQDVCLGNYGAGHDLLAGTRVAIYGEK